MGIPVQLELDASGEMDCCFADGHHQDVPSRRVCRAAGTAGAMQKYSVASCTRHPHVRSFRKGEDCAVHTPAILLKNVEEHALQDCMDGGQGLGQTPSLPTFCLS